VPVEALLFDLGGVVIEIDFGRTFEHWGRCAGVDAQALRASFRIDDSYRQYETGRIDAPAYFEWLRRSLGVDLSDAEFEEGWSALFIREVPGIRALLEEAARLRPLYLFSNTNPDHHRIWASRFPEAIAPFRRVFVSSELGKRKPEPEAYHAVAQAIDVPPERILFFDDTLDNVHGARAVGMQAVHVQALADIERAIARLRDAGGL
jgi:putative hydrolase of the HAD superfamily